MKRERDVSPSLQVENETNFEHTLSFFFVTFMD